MDGVDKWDKTKYENWVRGAKGLEYLQEGLQHFVNDISLYHRDQTLHKITNTSPPGSTVQCCNCTIQNLLPEHAVVNQPCTKVTCIQQYSSYCLGGKPTARRKCPNGICSKVYDEIVRAHRFKDPVWENTKPTMWCSDQTGWSFAKCFQTKSGLPTSSNETHADALLSIILSNIFFQNDVAANLGSKTNVFSTAREISNTLLHSANMELEDSELQSYIDVFIAVLQDQKYLLYDQRATQPVQNLVQLKNNQIKVSLSEQLKLLHMRKDALQALERTKKKTEMVVEHEGHQGSKAEVGEARSGVLEESRDSDIHRRIEQTEATIQHLTNRLENQIKKPTSKQLDSTFVIEKGLPKLQGEKQKDVKPDEEIKRVLDKAWGKVIDYMKPDPVLDTATEFDLLGYRQIRDIREEKNTTEKNRRILEKVRGNAETDYSKLKTCLHKTGQWKIVKLLEYIERGEDTELLLKEMYDESTSAVSKMVKGGPLSPISKKKSLLETIADKLAVGGARRRKILRNDLINFYRRNHNTIPLSPLIEEKDAPLTEFYVLPNINKVKVARALGGGKEIKTPITSLQEALFNKKEQYSEIYLTADAGLGKTAFSKRLTLAWCQAHKPIKNECKFFSTEEVRVMKQFDFVFLIFLRDSTNECDIDEMIMNHIITGLAHTSWTENEVENLFSKEKCLVILDGLDEWTQPVPPCKQGKCDIPHRKARECTILTTSRPWKLSVINLKSTQIDQRLELAGLSPESANMLKKNALSNITGEIDEKLLQEQVDNFSSALEERDIIYLEQVPLLLMFLLCLWCDEIDLGKSKSELYCNIIELLLSRTVRKYEHLSTLVERPWDNMPQCFSDKTQCRKFYKLLTSLAELAFQTLFTEGEGNALVFDKSMAEECLNEGYLKLSLQSGILTQNKVPEKLIRQEPKISFAHKTVQEFFAALHMHSANDEEIMKKAVMLKCSCIRDILEMSKVFIFLSGINMDMSSLISHELMEIINADETAMQHRTMTHVFDVEKYMDPLKETQNMNVSCMRECPKIKDDLKFCWQDVFIDADCLQEGFYSTLQQLAVMNKETIQSVSIDMMGFPFSLPAIINDFQFTELACVHKIYYRGAFDNCDVLPLLHKSVRCLSMISCKWKDGLFIGESSTWSPQLSSHFYSLNNLEAINIDGFEMSHNQIDQLVEHLSLRKSMLEIELENILCTDHIDECVGFRLDLSQHSRLRTFCLSMVPLSELDINVSVLEECDVGPLTKPGLVSHLLHHLPEASKLDRFLCNLLQSSKDIETMLNTLCLLVNVKHVWLWEMDLGNRAVTISTDMVNIEQLEFGEVTMCASAFRELVNSVHKLPQIVRVDLQLCRVKPEREFESIKREIRTVGHFRVLSDDENEFSFETIKDGN